MVLEGLLIVREQPPCVHSRDILPNAHCKDKQKILDGQTMGIFHSDRPPITEIFHYWLLLLSDKKFFWSIRRSFGEGKK